MPACEAWNLELYSWLRAFTKTEPITDYISAYHLSAGFLGLIENCLYRGQHACRSARAAAPCCWCASWVWASEVWAHQEFVTRDTMHRRSLGVRHERDDLCGMHTCMDEPRRAANPSTCSLLLHELKLLLGRRCMPSPRHSDPYRFFLKKDRALFVNWAGFWCRVRLRGRCCCSGSFAGLQLICHINPELCACCVPSTQAAHCRCEVLTPARFILQSTSDL
jgi:hypothetical protein